MDRQDADEASPYRAPRAVVDQPVAPERVRDPRAATRFLQVFLGARVVGVLLLIPLIAPGPFLDSPIETLTHDLWPYLSILARAFSTLIALELLALPVWMWRAQRNALALGATGLPPLAVSMLCVLVLPNLGTAMLIHTINLLTLAIPALILAMSIGIGHAVGRIADNAAAGGWSSPPLLKTWWSLLALQQLIALWLLYRSHTRPDLLMTDHDHAALIDGLLSAAGDLALILLAGRIARGQTALWQALKR